MGSEWITDIVHRQVTAGSKQPALVTNYLVDRGLGPERRLRDTRRIAGHSNVIDLEITDILAENIEVKHESIFHRKQKGWVSSNTIKLLGRSVPKIDWGGR